MAKERTAIDDLLDAFVESLRPAHDRIAAAPYAAIEVRKTDLRDAAAVLLRSHAEYVAGQAVPAGTSDARQTIARLEAELRDVRESHKAAAAVIDGLTAELNARKREDVAKVDPRTAPTPKAEGGPDHA